jgi:hypothetical protein
MTRAVALTHPPALGHATAMPTVMLWTSEVPRSYDRSCMQCLPCHRPCWQSYPTLTSHPPPAPPPPRACHRFCRRLCSSPYAATNTADSCPPHPVSSPQTLQKVVFIKEAITEEVANNMIALTLYLDSVDQKRIYYWLNCPGGEVGARG